MMRLLLFTICAALLFCACSRKPRQPTAAAIPPAVIPKNRVVKPPPPRPDSNLYYLNGYLKDIVSAAQHFNVGSSVAAQTIVGKKGSRITVVPSDLEYPGGGAAQGPIDVTLVELSTQADFLRNRAPTTSNGRLLVSGGSYYVGCSAGGRPLQLRRGKILAARFPRQTADGMKLFYGAKNRDGLINWTPSKQAFADAPAVDSITIKIPVLRFRDTILAELNAKTSIDLDKYRRYNARIRDTMDKMMLVGENRRYVDTSYREQKVDGLLTTVADAYEAIGLAQLGWVNCDRFQQSEKTTLALAAPGSSGAMQSFIVFKSINSVMGQQFDSAAGIYNNVPVGQPARLIVLSWKAGHPVGAAKDIVIEKNQQVQLALKPLSKRELLAMMGIGT